MAINEYFAFPQMINQRYLKISDNKMRIMIWDIQLQKEVLTIFPFSKQGWFATTPDGRYDGDENGLQFLHYSDGEKAYPLNHQQDKKFTKGLIQKILSN